MNGKESLRGCNTIVKDESDVNVEGNCTVRDKRRIRMRERKEQSSQNNLQEQEEKIFQNYYTGVLKMIVKLIPLPICTPKDPHICHRGHFPHCKKS